MATIGAVTSPDPGGVAVAIAVAVAGTVVLVGGGGVGVGPGLPVSSEYSSRLGEPLPELPTTPLVAELTMASRTAAGEAPGLA